jgi:hypothetical protein
MPWPSPTRSCTSTRSAADSSYKIFSISPTASLAIRMVVTVGRKATLDSFKGCLGDGHVGGDITKQDVVKALITGK